MEYTAKFLAQLLKGSVEGDENAKATKFAKIEHGKPGSLSFFANPKYEEFVYSSESSILIVDKTFQPKQPVKATMVRVENSYTSIAQLLKYVSDKKKKARRHRSLRARWFLSTKFGKRVYVGAYSFVGHHTVIGDNTSIYEHVYIGDDVTIGHDCINFIVPLRYGLDIAPGDELEVLSPSDSFNKIIKVGKMETETGEIIEDAKIVQQKIKLFTDVKLNAGDMLRAVLTDD